MKDYTEKAELYVSGLSSGSILPGSEQFTEVLKFLKSFRRHRAENPASGPLYRNLVGLSRKQLYGEIVRPLSGSFQLISKGEAHLLAGLLKQGDRSWFVKTVSSTATDEYDAMKALLNGLIPRSGQNFAFVVPDSVILNAGLVTYLSPAIANPAALVQDFRTQPNDVLTIVRGLAEMNVSLGCFPQSACPLPLPRQVGSLHEIDEVRLNVLLEGLSDASRDEFFNRLKQILGHWPDLERRFNEAKWGLAHGDLASLNGTVLDGKLVFLDLGKTGFGPLGSDLFWLLYKNRASSEDQRRIVSIYCEELGRHGVAVTEEEVYLSAMTRYAQKWLFPSRRGTKANMEHVQETQRAVLELLQQLCVNATAPCGKEKMENMSVSQPGEPLGGLLLPSGEVTSGKRHRRSLRVRNALVACGLRLEGKRVLDLGCAEGLHSLYFAQRAAEVVGVDHRKSKILIAQANAAALGAKNVRFIAGDIRDPEIFRSLGSFDLVVAWGFLHRITDIFSLLYSIEPLAKTLSLEWRTPVIPMMSRLSVAYHYPAAPALDPMNIATHDGEPEPAGGDSRKIEGASGFWEPTPGAVAAITHRLGFVHARLLGYDEDLVPEEVILERVWARHLSEVAAGRALLEHLPRGRLHMLFEKEAGAIGVDKLELGRVPLPKWDVGLQKSLARRQLLT